MGSVGWAIRIEPLEHQTTMQFLWETWRDALPRSLLDEARNWVSLGETRC